MTPPEWASFIKDIVTTLAAIIAAGVAFVGFRTWEQQLHWRTQYELAQRFLQAVYRVRNAFSEVRRWYTTEDEEAEAGSVKGEGASTIQDSDRFTRNQKTVYRRRWQKMQDALIVLDAVSLEAEAIWGAEVKENLKPLVNCVHELSAAIMIYLDKVERGLPITMFQPDDNKDQKIIFDTPGEQDNFFTDRITEAVKRMEGFLKPHLKI